MTTDTTTHPDLPGWLAGQFRDRFAKPGWFVLDLETTTADAQTARVVQIALQSTDLSGGVSSLVDPGEPIPQDSSDVHGILTEDVQGAPMFHELAPRVAELLVDCVALVGYNVRDFDVPVLARELANAGHPVDFHAIPVVDVFRLYQMAFPNTLSAVYERIVGMPLEDAHDAGADAFAALAIYDRLIRRGDAPADPESAATMVAERYGRMNLTEFDAWFQPDPERPSLGLICQRGKHRGRPLREIPRDYTGWLSRDVFTAVHDRRALADALVAGR